MLWVDKYRPKSFSDMDFNLDLNARLQKIAASRNQPHLLITGPSGAGKSTRMYALLRELYGSGAEKVKVETRTVVPDPDNPTNTVDIQVEMSNYHMAVTPSDIGIKDRAVIMQLIKEVASYPPLGGHSFKVVVIHEAGSLSHEAQAALRRTMERYMKTCRLILLCDSVSKIIAPLRSRCLTIRVGAPSMEQVEKVLLGTAEKEGFQLAAPLATRIAAKSDRDLQKALLILETMHAAGEGSTSLGGELELPRESWEIGIESLASKILRDQSHQTVIQVRGHLYDLMTACPNAGLPGGFILKQLLAKLLAGLAGRGYQDVEQAAVEAAARFEASMNLGSKDILHIEAFVLRFMAVFNAAPD